MQESLAYETPFLTQGTKHLESFQVLTLKGNSAIHVPKMLSFLSARLLVAFAKTLSSSKSLYYDRSHATFRHSSDRFSLLMMKRGAGMRLMQLKKHFKTLLLVFATAVFGVAVCLRIAYATDQSNETKTPTPASNDDAISEQPSKKEPLLPSSQASPYSIPWQLRPKLAVNVARLDSAIAFYNDRNGNSGGLAVASILTGSYKLIPDLAILARVGMLNNQPPGSAASATSLMNPLLGSIYSLSLFQDFRMSFFLGLTAPVGSGGGNYPDSSVQSANSAGILARSAMDNALFAVNYFTVIPGLDIAYIAHGWTIQLEATLLQLTRTRGEQIDLDPSRTNFTSGLALGYAVVPNLSLIGELRYQRWLDNATVSAVPKPAVENLSFAVGPRFTFKTAIATLRPGIAYAQGLVGPMANGNYTSPTHSDKIIFIDLPVIF